MVRHRLAALLVPVVAVVLAAPASAQIQPDYEWTANRPDGVAPVGVLGARTFEPGDLNFSYRFVGMRWDGNRIGTSSVSLAQVLDLFLAAPVQAEMNMHLLGVTFTPIEEVTLEASVPFLVSRVMDNVTAGGQEFEYDAGIWEDDDRFGFGDIKLLGHVPAIRSGSYRAHLTMGVSVPSGSIHQTDSDPLLTPSPTRSPYPLQIGSGTFDALPGFTVFAMNERASSGLTVNGVIRLHENALGYQRGNRVEASLWGAHEASDHLSVSFRVHTQHWGDISGADPILNPNFHPAANTALQGGTRVDLPVGMNVFFQEGLLAGHRLGIEASFPVYEDLNGPQLEHDWTLTAGWEYLLEME